MSSFMCCKETIWDIASYLCKEFPSEVAGELGGKPNIPELYRKLVDMNVSALKERYGEVSDLTEALDEYYNYLAHMGDTSNLISIKINMGCYLYQCFEGNVPNTSLYKLVDKAHYRLCDKLVQSLAEVMLGVKVLDYWR